MPGYLQMQPYLQISLDVRGRACLVIGGGASAEERVVRLLEGQARVVVVAAQVSEALARWSSAGRLEWRARPFETADLDGIFVAMVCEPDPQLADRVWHEAGSRGVLVYAQDRPQASHLAMPALVRRGYLRLAISTGEASPALAGRLRAELERVFDQRFVEYLTWLDELRTQLREEEPDPARRAERLRAAVEGFSVNAVLHYPSSYRR